VLDYDREADRYDRTRGGEPRAQAAAEAIERLLPPGTRTHLDVACGTGIVTRRLVRPGRTVFGADRSAGMARFAASRLGPGRVVLADGAALPLAGRSVEAVSMIWLLHLVPDASALVAEAARVLRPGGVLVTTVDKNAGYGTDSDVERLLAPWRRPDQTDAVDAVLAHARAAGLRMSGETTFTGYGQGRTPAGAADEVRTARFTSLVPQEPGAVKELIAALEALPDQDTRRTDPVYRLIGLCRED
jgi:SAM-dependent methyltransferase